MELKKETLERLYWQENMSMPEIMEKLGITEKKLTYWMNKYKIRRRTKSEAAQLYFKKHESKNRKYFFDDEWKQLYESGLSTCKIAQRYGCAQSDVWRHLKRLGVNISKIRKPVLTDRFAIAYLTGVLRGDGYIYRDKRPKRNPSFYVQTKTKQFANNIFQACKDVGLRPTLRKYKQWKKFGKYKWVREYYYVRCTFPEFFAILLENFIPKTREEKIGFVKGFFDSEGSTSKKKYGGVTYYRVRIYNENIELLKQIKEIIGDFNIEMKLYRYKKGSHIAVQTKEGFHRFQEIFGNKFDYNYVKKKCVR